MAKTKTLDSYRTGYISERWDVSDNCARALQLFELGFSASGAAKHLSVTESTVRSYINRIADTIDESAVYPIGSGERDGSLDVYGRRDSASDYSNLGYEDGVTHAKEVKNVPKTESPDQLDEKDKPQELPRNKGVDLKTVAENLS
jgi:hypothetical protein